MTALSSLTVPELAERVRNYWGPNQAPQLVMAPVAELARRAEERDEARDFLRTQTLMREAEHDACKRHADEAEAHSEALAEALDTILPHLRTREYEVAHDALARYRGEK